METFIHAKRGRKGSVVITIACHYPRKEYQHNIHSEVWKFRRETMLDISYQPLPWQYDNRAACYEELDALLEESSTDYTRATAQH